MIGIYHLKAVFQIVFNNFKYYRQCIQEGKWSLQVQYLQSIQRVFLDYSVHQPYNKKRTLSIFLRKRHRRSIDFLLLTCKGFCHLTRCCIVSVIYLAFTNMYILTLLSSLQRKYVIETSFYLFISVSLMHFLYLERHWQIAQKKCMLTKQME